MTDLEIDQQKRREELGNGAVSDTGYTQPTATSGGFYPAPIPRTPATNTIEDVLKAVRSEFGHRDLPSLQAFAGIPEHLTREFYYVLPPALPHTDEKTSQRSLRASRATRVTGPLKLLRKVMEAWNFNDRETAIVLGFDDPAIPGKLYRGVLSLRQRDANDRLRAVLQIAADLSNLYRNEAAIRTWLDEPQPMIDNATPRSLLTEGSMENVLRVRQYVEYLSGR